MARAFNSGKTVLSTKATGAMVELMALVPSFTQMATSILGYSREIRPMASVSILITQENNTLETGLTMTSMVMELKNLRMAQSIAATLRMARRKAKESW